VSWKGKENVKIKEKRKQRKIKERKSRWRRMKGDS
jgi:hypothetical protein